MYRPGDAQLVTAETYKDERWQDDERLDLGEVDQGYSYRILGEDARVPLPYVRLPHSCDKWIIGRAAEVRQMIADLTALLAEMEAIR